MVFKVYSQYKFIIMAITDSFDTIFLIDMVNKWLIYVSVFIL